jgi:hypothetical protein
MFSAYFFLRHLIHSANALCSTDSSPDNPKGMLLYFANEADMHHGDIAAFGIPFT